MKRLSYFILLFILLTSCKDNTNVVVNTASASLTTDSSKLKFSERYYKRAAQMSNLLNLNRLDRGVDSVEVRLWTASMLIPEQLLTIKYVENQWRVTETLYWTSKDKMDSLKSVSLTPKLDVSKFMDSLQAFGLKTFLGQDELQGFEDNIADGVNYVFEVRTKEYYNVFSYHCPDLFEDAGNRKATELVRLFSRNIAPVMYCKY